MRKVIFHCIFVCSLLYLAVPSFAQVVASRPPPTIFRDHDGNLVSNNEFVDIRMANFHYPDATIVKTLEDGTIEFRLQKIPQEGMMAPDFAAKALDGSRVDLRSLKGKVVVLNFWFIACASCRAHQPKLNVLKSKFAERDDVVFIAITYESSGDVKKYLAKERFDFIQITDADAILKPFRFSGYPKNIVLNKDGEIVYWRSPVAAWDKFESVIRAETGKD